MESHGDAEEAHPFAKKWPHKTHTSAAGDGEDSEADGCCTATLHRSLHTTTGAGEETAKAPPSIFTGDHAESVAIVVAEDVEDHYSPG